MDEPGYVYVLINPSFEGLVKIGKSQRDPEERAKELSSATGVPTPYYVGYKVHIHNCSKAERIIHELLEEARVADNREFFKTSLDVAIEVVNNVTKSMKKDTSSTSSPIPAFKETSEQSKANLVNKKCAELLSKADAHINGYGNTLQDTEKGLRILERAAELGCVEAYRELGDLYYYGEDVPENKKAARKYYQKGIETGDDTFWRNMGKTYSYEHPDNWYKCYKNYFHSSQFAKTSISLGQIQEKASAIVNFLISSMGQSGVVRNPKKAVKRNVDLLRWPLQQDIFLLGRLYQDYQNQAYSGATFDECYRLVLEIQAESDISETGSDQDCIKLLVQARKLLKGVDLKDRDFENPHEEFWKSSSFNFINENENFDPERGRRLLIEAVELGCKDAYRELGDIYQYGDGINPDKKKAYGLYKQGVEQGNYECWIGMANLFKWTEYDKWKVCWVNYLRSDSFVQQSSSFNYLEAKALNARSFLDSLYLWLTSRRSNGDEPALWTAQIKNPEYDFERIYMIIKSESAKDKVFGNSLARLCEILSDGWRGKDSDRSAYLATMAIQFA